MNSKTRSVLLFFIGSVLTLGLTVAGCGDFDRGEPLEVDEGTEETEPGEPGEGVSFETEVLPALEASCAGCHGAAGNFELSESVEDAYNDALDFVVPGDPEASQLLTRARGDGHQPIFSEGDDEYQAIHQWIEEGAEL